MYLMALGVLLLSTEATAQVPASCPSSLATIDIIEHDFSVSFCELCGVGTARLVVENPYRRSDDVDFSDIVVVDNLAISGLTYVPGSTRFDATNVAPPPLVEPVVSGPNGSILTWNLSDAFVMDASPSGSPATQPSLAIEFDVRRHAAVGE